MRGWQTTGGGIPNSYHVDRLRIAPITPHAPPGIIESSARRDISEAHATSSDLAKVIKKAQIALIASRRRCSQWNVPSWRRGMSSCA